ncbi:MAG: Gfo/Idh/MocA family oxidoreductase [Fuerstiella sp.]|nr:Gfo/Idh/MocA family oxidoreductase [Fuerstiella sp.]
MERRHFVQTAVATGLGTGAAVVPSNDTMASSLVRSRPKYRAGIIGLGWMGLLYDLAERIPDRFDIHDVNRPTPKLNVHRQFHYHTHPGNEGLPTSYAEALWDRPEVELVAGGERDKQRLKVFGDRYGIEALYTDGVEMMRKEKLDIVAICTNTKGRAFLTVKAAELGAKAIFTEKPMAHTLDEADAMVRSCADRGIPLCCGSITTTHPSFANAKELVQGGIIGDVLSIEASGPSAQHQNWSYFLESAPAWVVGIGDSPRRKSGSDEFTGQGVMSTKDGQMVHFLKGAPGIRLSGSQGEMTFDYNNAWQLWQDVETKGGKRRVQVSWPQPQFVPPYGAVYCLADILDCLENKLDEPKNSGRRVAVALEVEIAMKQSAKQGGKRIELPLTDRSLGLNYDWFR